MKDRNILIASDIGFLPWLKDSGICQTEGCKRRETLAFVRDSGTDYLLWT